jgi:hypothetical protein
VRDKGLESFSSIFPRSDFTKVISLVSLESVSVHYVMYYVGGLVLRVPVAQPSSGFARTALRSTVCPRDASCWLVTS